LQSEQCAFWFSSSLLVRCFFNMFSSGIFFKFYFKARLFQSVLFHVVLWIWQLWGPTIWMPCDVCLMLNIVNTDKILLHFLLRRIRFKLIPYMCGPEMCLCKLSDSSLHLVMCWTSFNLVDITLFKTKYDFCLSELIHVWHV
jgi:hypothetical protein